MLASRTGRMPTSASAAGDGVGVDGKGVMGARVVNGDQRFVSRLKGRGWMSTVAEA